MQRCRDRQQPRAACARARRSHAPALPARRVDETKTGTIDKAEFGNLFDVIRAEAEAENNEKMAMAKKQAATARKTKLFGCVAAVMGVFLAVSVAANFAVMFSVVDNAVKTTVSHTGYLEVKGSDKIVQTAEATETLPMFVAPVLPFEQLAATKVIKVKYAQAGGLVETQMAVAGVRRHNSTFVEFITTVPGEVVRTLNGEAHLIKNPTFANQLTEPQLFPICAADTECSAFTTEKTDADALTTMAVDELAKAGFGSYQEDHRRGLHSTCGPYHCHQVGSWVTFSEVFGSADGSGRVADVKVRFYDQPTGDIQHVKRDSAALAGDLNAGA